MSVEVVKGQIWIARPWRVREREQRKRLIRIIAVHPETITYALVSDSHPGHRNRQQGILSRPRFSYAHSLYRDAP